MFSVNCGGSTMTDRDLSDWFDECFNRDFVRFAERLPGNDTLANGAHRAGPYIPKSLLFRVLPGLDRPRGHDPDAYMRERYSDGSMAYKSGALLRIRAANLGRTRLPGGARRLSGMSEERAIRVAAHMPQKFPSEKQRAAIPGVLSKLQTERCQGEPASGEG